MRHIHFQQEVREMLDSSQGGWMVPALGSPSTTTRDWETRVNLNELGEKMN